MAISAQMEPEFGGYSNVKLKNATFKVDSIILLTI